MGSTFLELQGVAKAFGPRPLFRGVNLTVQSGEICLLTGSNGAGKSTLMRIMAGLTRPDAGRVQHNVEPSRLGYLGHTPCLYPGLTGLENLIFWAKAQGLPQPRQAAAQALQQVGLERHAHDRAAIYSRGMIQRLALARLIQMEAQLVLLDEPGTGLDESARNLLADMVSAIRQRGSSVIWISHDADRDATLADRVFLLHKRTLCEK